LKGVLLVERLLAIAAATAARSVGEPPEVCSNMSRNCWMKFRKPGVDTL
jgi:hypothetical protein